jgi:hypothetical protein
MIEKFAYVRRMPVSEFLDPNHPSNTMIPVFLVVARFARDLGIELRRTSEAGH